jgi:CheY-like chemotaxis protein
MLRQFDWQCTIAESAEEALQALDEILKMNQRFQLIFVKLILPDMNGFDAATAIREIETKYGAVKHLLCGLSHDVSKSKGWLICRRFGGMQEIGH